MSVNTVSTVIHTKTYNPLATLVHRYVNAANRPYSGGKAKRDEMAHIARVTGECEGVASGIAALVNVERAKRFSAVEWIDECHDTDLRAWLGEVVERVRKDNERRMQIANSKEDDHETRKAAVRQIDEEQWAWIVEGFNERVAPPELDEKLKEARKQAILKGELEPTEDDREWLAEHVAKAKAEAEKLAAILGPSSTNVSA